MLAAVQKEQLRSLNIGLLASPIEGAVQLTYHMYSGQQYLCISIHTLHMSVHAVQGKNKLLWLFNNGCIALCVACSTQQPQSLPFSAAEHIYDQLGLLVTRVQLHSTVETRV